ncbi:MAG TPA: hypothetical protein PKY82_03800 [Pyrinomonadaceae bacterium]|nr:hypothetical protein [Pyrinomonadaceae bacterium]
MTKRYLFLSLIGLVGLAIVILATNRISAKSDDLKVFLGGESSKTWELGEVKTDEKEMKDEDFDGNKEFAMQSELAQMVPVKMVFKADGTCENTYVSHYVNGKLTEDDLTLPCKWSVDGKTVEIIENTNNDNKIQESNDEVFWLKDVETIDKDFNCAFSLQGDYTAGVERLEYLHED